MSAYATSSAIKRGVSFATQPYDEQIAHLLTKVTNLVTFVEGEHFSQPLLHQFWRRDSRAQLTVSTIGRMLARPLGDELNRVHEMLEQGLPQTLFAFTEATSPALFGAIDAIRPATAPMDDPRAVVEQLHYAADTRQVVLLHILTSLNLRYQTPRFNSLNEAAAWTQAFAQNIEAAETVIRGSRDLLRQEMAAASAFLRQISNDIQVIETAAEAKFGVIKRLQWSNTLEEAELAIQNALGGRAERIEGLTFALFNETKNASFLQGVGRALARRAPRLGLLFVGLAGSGAVAHAAQKGALPQVSVPSLPQALRGQANPQDTARFASLNSQPLSNRSARVVSEAVQGLVGSVQNRARGMDQGVQARNQVEQFFDNLRGSSGRQTLVLRTQGDVETLVRQLTAYGYNAQDVLGVLGLSSVEAFSQPITLDMRDGRLMPILFPYNAAAQMTAPQAAIAQATAVYAVRPGDTLTAIGETFGLSVDALKQANPSLANPNLLVPGQQLTVPGAASDAARNVSQRLNRGATLAQVAEQANVPVAELASLNGIANPDGWTFQGGALQLPALALAGLSLASATTTQTTAAVAVVSNPVANALAQTSRLAAMPTPAPGEAYIVYRVQPDETLADIAARYGATVEQVIGDNQLADSAVQRGQNLLLRRPQVAGQGPFRSHLDSPAVRSSGTLGQQSSNAVAPQSANSLGDAVGGAARLLSPAQGQEVVARYGSTLFPQLEAMPPDAQAYLVGNVQEIAAFFNVRPGDVMGILRLEQNNAGWRLQETRRSSAGATGVGQIVTRTWNGWANPEHDNYVRNVADIEEHGGLGFDWSKREAWRAWQEGRADRASLADTNADPTVFENSVAGVARHLVNWGLTNDVAQRDPEGFSRRLADAIAVYNSGRTLDQSANWVQSSANHKTTAQYVAEAMATSEQVARLVGQPSVVTPSRDAAEQYATTFKRLYDETFGVALSQEQLERAVAANPVLWDDVRFNKVDPETGARQLIEQAQQHYIAQGFAALRDGRERPWPFVHNHDTLHAQQRAVALLGHPLSLYELDDLMFRTRADRAAIDAALMTRADARLFTQGKHLFDQMLNRSGRQQPIFNSEVASLVQPLLAGHSPLTMSDATLQTLADQLQGAIQALPEYKQLHGTVQFAANPLLPMPASFKGFGVSVDYQAGGRHTGLDLANPRGGDGKEPMLYAVGDATVVHVGPLYCDTPNACRGGKAIVLDHGNQVYSLYSHNSEATVQEGQRVSAGQPIGRQGSEGFSYGSHLHFEVHTGAPFSGDWEEPFAGGQFVDPAEWLPK